MGRVCGCKSSIGTELLGVSQEGKRDCRVLMAQCLRRHLLCHLSVDHFCSRFFLGNKTLLCTRRHFLTEPALSVSFVKCRVSGGGRGVGGVFTRVYSVSCRRSNMVFCVSALHASRVTVRGGCPNMELALATSLSAVHRVFL